MGAERFSPYAAALSLAERLLRNQVEGASLVEGLTSPNIFDRFYSNCSVGIDCRCHF